MNDDNSAIPLYLQPEQLRVGIYVNLELSWFKHDFARSDFKIRSEEQLREVLDLRLPRYRYDPELSDAPVTAESNQEYAKGITPTTDGVDSLEPTIAPGDHSTDVTIPPESAYLDVNDAKALLDEQQRARFLVRRELKIKEVEKSFVKAAGLLKNLNQKLLSKPKETVEDMVILVGNMVSAFLESPDVTLHIMGENAGGEDVYHHSLNVSILSMMLAKDLGFSFKMSQELGLGALVHDIGLMKIPARVLMKSSDEYTAPERNLRAMHVEYGVEIGRSLGFSTEVLAVIAQHHEFSDGSGYPNALKEAAMTPAARVVSLVNYYDNLCNPVDLSKAMTPHEALSIMFAQRRSKFETRALSLLIRSLGVYPPGSIVQLSNEAIAAVISINPKISTRPCVLVYDDNVPKEKAIILNLENETGISITKAIRPAVLPSKVAAYLNPRKRVTYFFDSDKQPESN